MPGKVIVTASAMVGKIKAAVDTREDANLQIIARTDIYQSQGLNAALDRLGAYREAGADLLMCLGPYDRAGAQEVIRRSPGPLALMGHEAGGHGARWRSTVGPQHVRPASVPFKK